MTRLEAEADLQARVLVRATAPIVSAPVTQAAPIALAAPVVAAETEPVSSIRVVESDAPDEGESAPWPDDSAEASFLADARERGETVTPKPAEAAEENDPKSLPPLETLVERIPPAVRESLEELFRAKFVRVQRVPRRCLKTGGPAS